MTDSVKPIRSKKEYEQALAWINEHFEAAVGSAEYDRLEVMSILVEAYEATHYPILPPQPAAAIRHRMEQEGLTQAELARRTGISPSHVSEVLNEQRELSLSMIRVLHRELDIPLVSLVGTDKAEAA